MTLPTPIVSATGPRAGAVNQPAAFHITCQLANGCGTLVNMPVQASSTGLSRTLGVNVNYSSCACATPGSTLQATYTFQPTMVGTYYLNFVAASGYITDTLVVK
ncbi:hypothetical protein [Hymenobacter sp. BRD67]|uniref:hypothetical protein n=1 Tax=Hymenobacter sp. BRD67 TaxID=2675877 RepID=UPI001563323B|nr:hypothetical protein [Hymenobacter sp. BRD67]QKG51527.1 hypothetical protein GKZ67_01625 [Hymenobacter sp. BRD67]